MDPTGLLGAESFEANPDGYSPLLSWLSAFGDVTSARAALDEFVVVLHHRIDEDAEP